MTTDRPCPFCERIRAGRVLDERGPAVAIADAFPLNPGHTLIIPRRHEPDFFALSTAELEAMLALLRDARARVASVERPDGFNLGVNVGVAAGQTIDRAHIHLIPRFSGDVEEPRGGVRWIIPARAAYWG